MTAIYYYSVDFGLYMSYIMLNFQTGIQTEIKVYKENGRVSIMSWGPDDHDIQKAYTYWENQVINTTRQGEAKHITALEFIIALQSG
jgi:hypothetical protein